MTFRILMKNPHPRTRATTLWQELAEVEAVGMAHALTRLQRDYGAGEYLVLNTLGEACTEVTVPSYVAA